jgi:multiple sugar transport system substrate-binding protein
MKYSPHLPIKLLLIQIVLVGCTSTPATEQPLTVTISPTTQPAGNVSFMIFGDPAELQAYQNLVKAFEAKFPDQKIDLIHIPDQADYRQRLAADFAAGTPADVVLINYRRFSALAEKGALEPLGPYLEKSSVIQVADFYPEAIVAFNWGRRGLMCIPQNVSSLVVYYNKNLFQAAGLNYPKADWTWDDFLATAQALTQDRDGDGQRDQHGLGVEPALQRVAPFIWQNGGDVVRIERSVWTRALALNDPPALEALRCFVALQLTHHVVPNAIEEEAENSESRFLNGRVAMYLNSRRGVPTYRTITAFDWDIAPLPRKRWRHTGVLHTDGYCLSARSPHKAAAWKFIEFANSVEGQTIVARSGRTVPSLKVVAESPAFLDPAAKPRNSRVFLDTLPNLRMLPRVANWPDIEEIANDEIKRAFYGQADLIASVQAAIVRTEEYFP